MDVTVFIVFVLVYAGMLLGRIPGLALDRTGVALLGAIALLAAGRIDTRSAWLAIDIPTMGVLLGLMVVSAQFRLSGFYSQIVRWLARAEVGPRALLALLVAVVGLLAAVLANDVVCLAVVPVLIEGCSRRGLDPKPFLLALACSANVGSAATLIGNPQNILVGQALHLSFARYLAVAALPAVAGLALVWLVICVFVRGRWHAETPPIQVETPVFDRWQTSKGLVVLAVLVAAFLATPWPREILALAAAGVMLCSRRMRSREMLGFVDWQLLVLFAGLFVVNHSLTASGNFEILRSHLSGAGIDARDPASLFAVTVVLSNLVSNVPAVMLLLPSATHPLSGPVLALSSTLAGNLIIVGSIANIIVVDQAARMGVRIGWREHARVGVPVTLLTLGVTALWLLLVNR